MKLNKKGISLIVLVITIIVMIILATAIILSLNSSNIVEKAKEAKTSSDTANIKQAATLAYSEYVLDLNEGKIASGTTAESYVKSKLMSQGVAEENLKRLMVSEKGKIFVVEIPEGFVASSVSTEDEISEGLVIRDTNGNEFVWVPVEDFSQFTSKNSEPATKVKVYDVNEGTYVEAGTLSLTNDLTGEWAEYTAMKASVIEHGGFYIARYEAGKEGTSSVVSKKNVTVWSDIVWGTSMIDVSSEGAVYLSRKMYEGSKSVVSTLIYGAQWDAALSFISKTDDKYASDSTDKGNYTDTVKPAGFYAVNNIYDMAGNVTEWTMTAAGYSSDTSYRGRIGRGYAVGVDGSESGCPAGNGDFHEPDETSRLGFRVALYLK